MELIKKLKNLIQKEDDKLNFKQIVEEWLQTKEISIKESTYLKYVYSINKYIMPTE